MYNMFPKGSRIATELEDLSLKEKLITSAVLLIIAGILILTLIIIEG